MVKISISVGGVDSATEIGLTTPNAKVALAFLRTHDHEGSRIAMQVEYDGAGAGDGSAEAIYRELERLVAEQR